MSAPLSTQRSALERADAMLADQHARLTAIVGQVVRTARKRWKCCNAHAAEHGNAPNCRRVIGPGEQYVEGDVDPYLAGGFGHDKLCLGCAPIAPPEIRSLAKHYLAKVRTWQAEPAGARDLALGLMGPNGYGPAIDDVCWQAEFHRRAALADPEQSQQEMEQNRCAA